MPGAGGGTRVGTSVGGGVWRKRCSGLRGDAEAGRAPPRSCRSALGYSDSRGEHQSARAPPGGGGLKPRRYPVGRPKSTWVLASLTGVSRWAPWP